MKNHVVFPNLEEVKNPWIIFLCFFFFLCLRPGVLCPTLLTLLGSVLVNRDKVGTGEALPTSAATPALLCAAGRGGICSTELPQCPSHMALAPGPLLCLPGGLKYTLLHSCYFGGSLFSPA